MHSNTKKDPTTLNPQKNIIEGFQDSAVKSVLSVE